MGALIRLADGTAIKLPARALLGRNPTSTIALHGRLASGEHARILWTGSAWELRDLGSRNGTYVNGALLAAGASRFLVQGDKLGFGESAPAFVLEDASAPSPMAFDLRSKEVIDGIGDLLQLPSSDQAEATIYRAHDGMWRVEDSAGVHQTASKETIEVAGRLFRLELPDTSDLTPMGDVSFSLPNLTIRFHVPASFERIALELVHQRRQQFLEPREHGYALLVLAQERIADKHLPEADRGWRSIQWLTQSLKADAPIVNVLIHRARLQLASAGVEGAAEIVEVKRGARRFGTDRVEIISDPGR